jgi:hypothetical protein
MWRVWFKLLGFRVVAVKQFDDVYFRFARHVADDVYCKDWWGSDYKLLQKALYGKKWWYV